MRLHDGEIDSLLRLGGMAPSGGNAQPWLVRIRPDALDVCLHPKRAESFIDVGHSASLFALGAFIENVSLAAAALGLAHDVRTHDPPEPRMLVDPVATVRFLARGPAATMAATQLAWQIPRRHTNRQLHAGDLLSETTIDALRAAAETRSSVRLRATSARAAKVTAARLIGKGDAIRLRHDVLFPELMSELRWTDEESMRSRDGIALSTLELPVSGVLLLKALRRFPAMRGLLPQAALERTSAPAVLGCSHLCLLSIAAPLSTAGLLDAGRAAQRVWLEATARDLAVQPITALPFMALRAAIFGGSGYSPVERDALLALDSDLRALYGVTSAELPLFIFRLSRPGAPASDRALRLPRHQLRDAAGEDPTR